MTRAALTDMAGQPIRHHACKRCGKAHQPRQAAERRLRGLAPYRIVIQRGHFEGVCVGCANRERDRLVAG